MDKWQIRLKAGGHRSRLRGGVLYALAIVGLWLAGAAARPATAHPAAVDPTVSMAEGAAYMPLIQQRPTPTSTLTPTPTLTPSPTPEPGNRAQARQLYLQEYLASEGTAIGWTGSHASCNPGDTTAAFRDAVLRRINYYRKMAGLPGVTLNAEYNAKAQAAALMMSANKTLDHSPASGWRCYSADGAQAAGSSNLALGANGWNAIDLYILEGGNVGHRRWVLYPQTQQMGTGDIPAAGGYPPANDLWVFDTDHMWGPRPATRDDFVAWPPPGYVPYQVVNTFWSFGYPQADFSSATVVVTRDGAAVSVQAQPVASGYGENTLVWEMPPLPPRSAANVAYHVEVRHVLTGGSSRDYAYDVVLFDPAQ